MKPTILLLTSLLAAGIAAPAGSPKQDNTIDAPAAFARLKTMAGTWEAHDKDGTSRMEIELIAGGTALVERETADSRPTMLTVYHLDNGRLLLTHYCMAGNQPRMQARGFDAKAGTLEFRFVDGTNLSPGAGHMHNVTIRFADSDHVATEWQFYQDGKPKMTEAVQYTRVR